MDEDLAAFVRARYPALVRRAYLLVGSTPAAEDLVQEALARTCDRRRRSTVTQLDAYVDRCLVNLAVSRWRRRRFVEVPFLEEQQPAGPGGADPDRAAQWDEQDALGRVLAELAPRQRAAVVLRYYDDLSESQVAQLLGISVGTVRSTTYRALERLRTLLVAPGPGHDPNGTDAGGCDSDGAGSTPGASREGRR